MQARSPDAACYREERDGHASDGANGLRRQGLARPGRPASCGTASPATAASCRSSEYFTLFGADSRPAAPLGRAVRARRLRPLRDRDGRARRAGRSPAGSCSTAPGTTARTAWSARRRCRPRSTGWSRTSPARGAPTGSSCCTARTAAPSRRFVACLQRALEHYSTLDEGALYRFNWIFPSQQICQGRDRLRRRQLGRARRRARDLRLPRRRADRGEDRRRAARPPAAAPAAATSGATLIEERLRRQMRPGFRPADYLLPRRSVAPQPADLRGAALVVPRRPRQGAAPRAGRALLRLAPLPAGGGHGRAAAGGRRALAAAHHGSLAVVAAAGAAVADAVRVPGRAGRRQPRHDRLRRPAQAPARVVQVPAGHGRAGPGLAGRRQRWRSTRCSSASSNEGYLAAFKEIPEFQSFKGRMELVRAPYLLDYRRRAEDLRGAHPGRASADGGQARRARTSPG